DLITKLRATETPGAATATGVLDASGKPVMHTAAPTPPEPVRYADLDAAKRALRGRAVSTARGAVDDAIMQLADGTPAAAKLRAADQTWGLLVAPMQRVAAKVAKAETPLKAYRVVMGDPARMRVAMQTLGADSPTWRGIQGAA